MSELSKVFAISRENEIVSKHSDTEALELVDKNRLILELKIVRDKLKLTERALEIAMANLSPEAYLRVKEEIEIMDSATVG